MDLALLVAAAAFAMRRTADTQARLGSFVVLPPLLSLAYRFAALVLIALWSLTAVPALPSLLVLSSAISLLLLHLQTAQTLFGLLSTLAWAVGYDAASAALAGEELSASTVMLATLMALTPLLRLLLGNCWQLRSVYFSALGLLLWLCSSRLPPPAIALLLPQGLSLLDGRSGGVDPRGVGHWWSAAAVPAAVHLTLFLLLSALSSALSTGSDFPGPGLGFDLAEDISCLGEWLWSCGGLRLGKQAAEAVRVAASAVGIPWSPAGSLDAKSDAKSDVSASRISEAEAILFVQRSLMNSKSKRAP